jgi:hypothetical protein
VTTTGSKGLWLAATAVLTALLVGSIWYIRAFHPRLPGTGPSLARSSVVSIARDEAARHNIDLSHYETPSISYEVSGERRLWFVHFAKRDRDMVSGAFFDVIVDDETEIATISPGA